MLCTAARSRKGFSLIEILVVIAIIGLLASVVSASLSASKIQARNTAEISSINELQKAFTLYANNNNGTLPNSVNVPGASNGYCCVSNTCLWGPYTDCPSITASLAPYISKVDSPAATYLTGILYNSFASYNAKPAQPVLTYFVEHNGSCGPGTVVQAPSLDPNPNNIWCVYWPQ